MEVVELSLFEMLRALFIASQWLLCESAREMRSRWPIGPTSRPLALLSCERRHSLD